MGEKAETVELMVTFRTEDAVQATDDDGLAWFPKALCEEQGDMVLVPLRLAQNKGLRLAGWEPPASTRDATLWLRRYEGYGDRLGAWLEKHEPRLGFWLRKCRPPGFKYPEA